MSTPAYSFTLPSLLDNTILACRIYHPEKRDGEKRPPDGFRGAVMAHPYAPLGGSYDDPVVTLAVKEFVDAGFVVAAFNFRGSRPSTGKTSWTARPELNDYQAVAAYLALHLLALQSVISKDPVGNHPTVFVNAGYSFGSIIASRMPSVQEIFAKHTNQLAAGLRVMQPAEETTVLPPLLHLSTSRGVHESISTFQPHYLLISPPLGAARYFLTLLNHAPDANVDVLTRNNTLAISGDKDEFTGAGTIARWVRPRADAPDSRFRFINMPGAGHFWNDEDTASQLGEAIGLWLRDICDTRPTPPGGRSSI